MYFQDAYSLESHLNNDWPVILKNLKNREDCHLELLQYNKIIISRQRDEDDELFVKDEISQHQQQFSKIQELNEKMTQEQKEIFQKYDSTIVSFQQIHKLMGRVGARILQTCQSSLEKSKSYDKGLPEKYQQMKSDLVKNISQKDSINLEEIVKITVNYGKYKLSQENNKLKKLIKALENGQYEQLEQVYTPQPPRPSLVIEKKKGASVDKVKVSSVGKQKVAPKEQIKKQEKIRKQKQKLAAKMVTGLYSTMDLSKVQLIEDMCKNNKQKSHQLYNQIFSRNKFNHQQIKQFQSKEEQFHQKVKIFKEMMERQSKRIAEVLIKKPIIKDNLEQGALSVLRVTNKSAQDEEKLLDGQSTDRKVSANRYRIHSPRSKKQILDFPYMHTSALQSTQENFNHLKFDTSNQEVYLRSNRNKLPQLAVVSTALRGSSLGHRLNANISNFKEDHSEKQIKNEINNIQEQFTNQPSKEMKYIDERQNIHRTKMVLKNIEVGVQGVLKRSDPIVHSRQKKKIEPNPMQYTFYVRNNGQKLIVPKHNIIF